VDTSAQPPSRSDRYRPIAAPLHTVLVLAAAGAWAFWGRFHSDPMRATGNPNRVSMYSRILLLEWLLFALVILGVWLRGSPLSAVLGDRWHSVRQVLRDIGIALAFWVASTLSLSIFMHLHDSEPNHAVQSLLPHGGFEKALWIAVSVTAGICEEAVYRGYLQRQFTALAKSVPAGILLSAAAFGAAHAYKGLWGAVSIAVEAVMLGSLAYWRGSVRPGMISHAWGDCFAGVLAEILKIKVG
jgi:membrane protease YdiL (CAAX protease family)